jgi:hypothetical protein
MSPPFCLTVFIAAGFHHALYISSTHIMIHMRCIYHDDIYHDVYNCDITIIMIYHAADETPLRHTVQGHRHALPSYQHDYKIL